MAPSNRPGSSSIPIRGESESRSPQTSYHVNLHPRQPFVRYDNHRRRPHIRNVSPTQGQVDRLPGVATLLRRHNAMQFRGINAPPPAAAPATASPPNNTSNFVECWSPSQFAAGMNVGTPPGSRWGPAVTTPRTPNDWTSNMSSSESTSDDSVPGNNNIDVRSPEPVLDPSTTRTKSSRYLREIDRRRILMRIAQGEKQSALAKEYHVSRAAICNLNKHRAEVLSRNHEHPLAKHPKRRTMVKSKKPDTSDNQFSTSSP